MEPTIIEGDEITVKDSGIGYQQISITQGNDVVVVQNVYAEDFITAVRKHMGIVDEYERAFGMNNMETIADTTISTSEFGTGNIVIDQDEDRIVVRREDIEEFMTAISRCGEENEPASEKWYVVLKGCNCRMTNAPGEPIIFTDYDLAARYGLQHGMRSDRWYLPMSVDHYERVFGR